MTDTTPPAGEPPAGDLPDDMLELGDIPGLEDLPELEVDELDTVTSDDGTDGSAFPSTTAEDLAEGADGAAPVVYKGSGIRWGFVTGLLLAVLLVVLVFQNTDDVSFRFLIWEIQTPLAALLIATAVIAAVADELVGLVVRARRRRRLAEKEELERLRSQSG